MNIFVLDRDVDRCASYLHDSHLRKMIVESAQMLCTAHRVLDNKDTIRYEGRYKDTLVDNIYELYKETHTNHPCTVWTRETLGNYLWHFKLFYSMGCEYMYRFGKSHKSYMSLSLPLSSPPNNINRSREMTLHPLVMPDIYKVDDAVESYREYYRKEKVNMSKYTKREKPKWATNYPINT
jgi:hypothetical protein